MILYNPTVSGSLLVTGSLTTTGTLTAQTLVVQTITSSVDFVTGSSVNGSLSSNTHQFTGSVFITGSATTLLSVNNSVLFVSASGNVGIGNTSPGQKLAVTQITNDASSVGFFTSASTGTSYGPIILAGTNSSDAALRVYNQAGTLTYLHIRGDGNIGIGTTSPDALLTVAGANQSLGGAFNTYGNALIYSTDSFAINKGGSLSFGGKYYSAVTTIETFARIHGKKESATDGATSGYLAFETTNDATALLTERMRITSTGNVGIGTSSPSDKLQVTATSGNGITITTNDVSTLKMNNTGGTTKNWGFATTNIAASDFGIYQSTSVGGDPISAGIRRLYFNGTGNVTITAPNHMQLTIKSSTSGDARFEMGAEDNVVIGFQMATTANDITWFTGRHRPGSAGITDEMNVYRGQTNLHRIQNNGNYSFAGSNVSDIRLKENIQVINYNATEKLQQLIPVSYNMIEHPTIHKSGFIAQEVKEVLPNFVTGNESEDEHLGVDYNGILALAVKAIQELKAEIDTLKQQQ